MLYIYGRIFRTIRQRSRSDLGEISSTPRCRQPPLWTHLTPSNEVVRDLPPTSIPLSSSSGDNNSRAESSTKKLLGSRLHQLITMHRANRMLKRVTNDEGLLYHRNKTDIYESLTLLEIKHEQTTACVVAIVGNDVTGGVTHCTNVRVKVEYVVEEGDSADARDTGDVAVNGSGQGAAARMNKCGDSNDPDGSRSNSNRIEKTNAYSGAVNSPGLISRKERKAARQLGVIMCAFMVCWLPYFIVFLVVAVCPTCIGDSLSNVTLWLGYINSTLNPVLYPLCNAKFRRAFAKMTATTCHLPCTQHQTYPLSKSTPSVATRSRYWNQKQRQIHEAESFSF